MSRKAPRAALPKPKMHPPGLAITGGYTATTTHTRYTWCTNIQHAPQSTQRAMCTFYATYGRALPWRSCDIQHSTRHTAVLSADAPKVLKGLPGTN
jgi:hypothetical protein